MSNHWNGPRRIAPEDMRSMKVSARVGKTAFERKNGTHGNRFINRSADPKRNGR